jgi:hypothetical protein
MDWVITKVSQPPANHPLAEEWPGCVTFTVEHVVTHEVRHVTCQGEGCVEQMIAEGRFDPDVGSESNLARGG